MKTLINRVLENFGLNRSQLAGLLELNRSQVTLLLNGARPIPGQQLQGLLALVQEEQRCGHHPAETSRRINVLPEDAERDRKQLILETQVQLQQWKRKLAMMEKKWEAIEKNNRLCNILQQEHWELSQKQVRWLQELQYQNQAQEAVCNPGQQWIAACRIEGLEALLKALEWPPAA